MEYSISLPKESKSRLEYRLKRSALLVTLAPTAYQNRSQINEYTKIIGYRHYGVNLYSKIAPPAALNYVLKSSNEHA